MIKVLSVFGTRPEAIKMAPIVRELMRRNDQYISKVCVTAQHRSMLDQVLHLFGIVPDYDLNVMQHNQSSPTVASAVLAQLEPILLSEQPDWVLVQGDTTTVAAASLAAFYTGAKVGHIEAGLRTHNKWKPFPEEINRRIASVIADLHFAPTERSRQNLLQEDIPNQHIFVTGNPVIDSLHYIIKRPFDMRSLDMDQSVFKDSERKIILVTAHRRENFGQPLENICIALNEITARYDRKVHIIYPVHLNPNVQSVVYRSLKNNQNITLIPPLDYLPLVNLMKRSYIVLTDSGGIQEEAPGLGKPVLVLRDETERPEAVEAGTVQLVGTDKQKIVAEVVRLLENKDHYSKMAHAVNPYGDGHAAERIVSILSGEKPLPTKN